MQPLDRDPGPARAGIFEATGRKIQRVQLVQGLAGPRVVDSDPFVTQSPYCHAPAIGTVAKSDHRL